MTSERNLEELAADYVAGNLSAKEANEFARLVVEYPELRTEVSQLEKIIGLVLDELPMLQPPQYLRDRVLARVDIPVRSQQPYRGWILAAVAAGAALLSLALGISNHRLRLANQQLQQELLATMPAQQAQLILQQPTTRFYDFAGTDNAANAFGSMIVDTDGLQAAIAFENLSPLPTEQTYALWVRYQGEYVPCGVFHTNQDGTVFATLPMPPVYQSRPWVNDVIVTVEPSDLSAQPTGPIVASTT